MARLKRCPVRIRVRARVRVRVKADRVGFTGGHGVTSTLKSLVLSTEDTIVDITVAHRLVWILDGASRLDDQARKTRTREGICNKSRCRRTHIVLFHRTDSDEGQRELAMRIKGIYEKNSQEES